MTLLSSSTGSDIAQFITVLIVFVFVLFICVFTTKLVGNYQKVQGSSGSAEVIETLRITQGKWIQIIKIGTKYKVIAICKDTVTYLGEVDAGDIREITPEEKKSFTDVLAGMFPEKKE